MNPRRASSPPPAIDGFEPIKLLGQGGFADVFLYQQLTPSRHVAIKVLLPDRLDEHALAQFSAEADAMAQLSSHPHIVTIYGSGIADGGRPYLTMEYCPLPSLNVGLRRHIRSVAEVLTIGVEVSGAVESAHRVGILHRDIKPANILVTQYEAPVLTDFGIAVARHGDLDEAEGMSVPWAPPEFMLPEPWAGVQSDVWSLGATVYTLLAQRAPFELPGMDNSPQAQAGRIRDAELTPIPRPDMPPSLMQLLARAMAKDPVARPHSAKAFGRALREVQEELQLSPTPLVVINEFVDLADDPDDEAGLTRLRTVNTTDSGPMISMPPPMPEGDPGWSGTSQVGWSGAMPPAAPAPASQWPSDPQPGAIPPGVPPGTGGIQEPLATTRLRGDGTPDSPPPGMPAFVPPSGGPAAPERKRPPKALVGAVIGAVVLIGAVVGIVLSRGGTPDPGAAPAPGDSGSQTAPTQTSDSGAPPPETLSADAPPPAPPIGLTHVNDGMIAHFAWTAAEPAEGDTFQWRLSGQEEYAALSGPGVDVEISATDQTCIEVATVHGDGQVSEPAQVCAPKTVTPPSDGSVWPPSGGEVRFEWTRPNLGEGDHFEWRQVANCQEPGEGEWTSTPTGDATAPYVDGTDTFIQVRTVKASGDLSQFNVFHTSLNPSESWCVAP
ncbi:MAG: protein kinase [Bifidobacteriaceae bacterium]|jgi:serine/threonine protein kinase|nr:protein kinase [Bifidobacteriaceae bacterium]